MYSVFAKGDKAGDNMSFVRAKEIPPVETVHQNGEVRIFRWDNIEIRFNEIDTKKALALESSLLSSGRWKSNGACVLGSSHDYCIRLRSIPQPIDCIKEAKDGQRKAGKNHQALDVA